MPRSRRARTQALAQRPRRPAGTRRLAPGQLGVRPRRAGRGRAGAAAGDARSGAGARHGAALARSERPRSARTRWTRPRACSAPPSWATSSAGSSAGRADQGPGHAHDRCGPGPVPADLAEGAFHDGATSDPADVRHLVDLARDATADADVDLAMQLLFGAARRVWWRDPGEAVRRDIVSAARAVPLPAATPGCWPSSALAESLELSGHHRAAGPWPVDATVRPPTSPRCSASRRSAQATSRAPSRSSRRRSSSCAPRAG